jgi:hypothetical protein
VEWWHWRGQVTEARAIVATEVAGNLRRTIRRMRETTCVERRLDELSAILDKAAKTGSLPPLGDIASPPHDYWQKGAWESLVASEVVTHFPRQQLADITYAYDRLALLAVNGPQEHAAWSSLFAMVGPGRRLDPASEARLRDALSQARSLNRQMSYLSSQITDQADSLGLTFTPQNRALIAQGRNQPLLGAGAPTSIRTGVPILICTPLGKAPPLYGQGSGNVTLPMVEDALKHLPDYASKAP